MYRTGSKGLSRIRVFIVLATACVTLKSIDASSEQLAPGYGSLPFPLAEVGSYELPSLGVAGNGLVVTDSGEEIELHQALGENYALLSFMYASCSDVNGCPLTAYVFYRLKKNMQLDSELAKNLKLVSLSFDPVRDTPSALKNYAANFLIKDSKGEWHFFTTDSEAQLLPILKSYNQEVQKNLFSSGSAGAELTHILRVFLIDPQKRIRNIYSVPYLHPEIIRRDLKTLLTGQKTIHDETIEKNVPSFSSRFGPGDFRGGYESEKFISESAPLNIKRRDITDKEIVKMSSELGLPYSRIAKSSEIKHKAALGRRLFFDRRLSLNNTISCANCHIPEQGFTSNEVATSVGIEGRTVARNAPTLYNIGFSPNLFHDGREDSLVQQIWSPLLDRNEMGNPSVAYVLNKIRSIPDYTSLFTAAFGDSLITMETLGQALAAYQNHLFSGNSLFDRWYYGNELDAFNAEQKRGFELFSGKAGCINCHVISEKHALFSDYKLRNTGIGYIRSMPNRVTQQTVQIAPGIFTNVDYKVIQSVGEPRKPDLGLYHITQNPEDRWKFRTPSLRNVELTQPYMHDGSISTLHEVVEFYNKGGIQNPLLDPLIKPLNLSKTEIHDIVGFLRTLTGNNVEVLVAEATTEIVGDVGISRKKGEESSNP